MRRIHSSAVKYNIKTNCVDEPETQIFTWEYENGGLRGKHRQKRMMLSFFNVKELKNKHIPHFRLGREKNPLAQLLMDHLCGSSQGNL